MKVELLTSQEVFEALHELTEGRRTKVKVEAEALKLLLIDHSKLEAAVTRMGGRVINPTPKRQRLRLQRG